MENVNVGDIVQIIDEKNPWFPCLLIVTEVKKWGIQGYVKTPKHDGLAFYRVVYGSFKTVGRAFIVYREID